MSNEKRILLIFDLEEVTNDVLVKCNQISKSIREDAMEDIKANVLEPDHPESRSIVNRAITEAFGKVKTFCQRYLRQGRTIDSNTLERMVKDITYVKEQSKDIDGHLLYECTVTIGDGDSQVVTNYVVYNDNGTWKNVETGYEIRPDEMPEPLIVDTDEVDTIEYEKIPLELFIPNFNVAVTDDLKSSIHKYVVDYVMARFLQDQLADKAAEYKALADGEDRSMIIKDLNARETFNMRRATWV